MEPVNYNCFFLHLLRNYIFFINIMCRYIDYGTVESMCIFEFE